MKLRESGMPDESLWESLFDVPEILHRLAIDSGINDVVELGCGHGTFTLPVARCISGTVLSFDIDPDMVRRTQTRAGAAGAKNVLCCERDVAVNGFGLRNACVDACLLFNILHCEEPVALLAEAARVVRPGGRVLVIHWRYDPNTPRGPSIEIRPRPEQIVDWAEKTGRLVPLGGMVELPPWHYGWQLRCLAHPHP